MEKGISTFTLEQHDDQLVFTIKTISEPAYGFVKIFGPLVALPYQAFCTRLALKNVKQTIEKA